MLDIAEALSAVAGMPLPQAAEHLAASGLPVFPCVPQSKRPLVGHGFLEATADAAQVREWWARCPAANVAVPSGSTSGLDVVDVDRKGGASGFLAFERARRAGLVDGWAATVRTPSGGLHAYYPAVPSRPQRSWQSAAAHIDFRGDGGYVLVPPSQLARDGSRATYALITARGSSPRPVDAAALRAFLEPRAVPRPGRTIMRRAETVDAARLAAWLAGRVEGERNRSLFWAACRLAEAGFRTDDTLAALGPAAERIGLGEREVATTIRSAYRITSSAPDRPATRGSSAGPGRRRPPRRDAGPVLR